MSLSELQENRYALGLLCTREDHNKRYWHERDNCQVVLETHPFGLETNLKNVPNALSEISLIAYPGHTEPSVRAMKCMLVETLRTNQRAGSPQFRLRITRVPIRAHRDPAKCGYDLYFEIIADAGVFICGGCNDVSGEGGAGGRTLTTIFNFVGRVHDVPVESVVLKHRSADDVLKELMEAYNQFTEERQR